MLSIFFSQKYFFLMYGDNSSPFWIDVAAFCEFGIVFGCAPLQCSAPSLF